MLNVQIVQPLVPEYRVPFFESLARDGQCHIQVFASATLPGSQSLRSASTINPFIHLDHPCIDFLNHRVLWQKGLRLEDRLRPGDVLVVCGNPRLLSNYPLIWKAKRRDIATVWWGIGTMPGQHRLRGLIRRFIMRWMDAVLLYTDREVQEYKQLGFPADRLFATNNAIDQEPVQHAIRHWTADRLQEFQQKQALTEKQVFLFCGRLSNKARLDLAIDALAHLTRQSQGYVLVVIGDGEENVRLREHAAKKGVDNSIRWLGAIYDQAEMAPWFLCAKGFVYPGYVGLSLLHAMGYGLPVITHKNLLNQSPEIAALRDGQNGLLFEEGSVEELAGRISFLATNETARNLMSEQATRTAMEEFTMKEMVRRFVEAVYAAAAQVSSPHGHQLGSPRV